MLVLIIKSDFIMENSYMDESKLLRYFRETWTLWSGSK